MISGSLVRTVVSSAVPVSSSSGFARRVPFGPNLQTPCHAILNKRPPDRPCPEYCRETRPSDDHCECMYISHM